MLVRRSIIFVSLIVFLFGGCGTSDSTNDSADNNFTILEGSVPGTLIEAFCTDGSYYHTYSTKNGTQKHPFSLKIPKNLNCRLIMSTNEDNLSKKVVTPLRIDTPTGNSPLFYGKSDKASFDYIPLALSRNEITDQTGDGVSDELLDVKVKSGTLVPITPVNDPLDKDNDGIPNIYEDDDADGLYNEIDDDDDNDGIKDMDEDEYKNDHDGDGIKDDEDRDDDNDGIDDDDDDDDYKKYENYGFDDHEDDDDDKDKKDDD